MRTERGRRGGFTLLEVAVALGLVSVVLASLGMVFSTISASASESDRRLLAQMENDRALLALLDDLHTTSTIWTDGEGNPCFRIEDDPPGSSNAIVFRRVEGFSVDPVSDIVEPIYGQPIRYAVAADGSLIRTQAGERRVIANRVSALSFTLSPTGTVGFTISTSVGEGKDRVVVENTLSVTPRNGLER